jgi:hypothetical protein
MCDERLVGGVLRTSAGQRHGKATLDARIAQLNAIEAAKQNFFAEGNDHTLQIERTPFAGAEPSMDALLGATPLVELAQVLQSIKDNIYASDFKATGRDTLQDFSKIFPLIVRMASNNTASDIANVLEFIEGTSAEDGIIQLLNTKIETIQEAGFNESSNTKEIAYFNRLTVQLEWWQKVCNYLKKMLEIAEAPAKTRQNASQAYIKSFGFARLSRDIGTTYRTNIVPEDTFIDTTGHVDNPQNAQRAGRWTSKVW